MLPDERKASNGVYYETKREYDREFNLHKRWFHRAFANRVKTKYGCKKCGYNEHPVALHFNHIDPASKTKNVGNLISQSYSLSRIKEEMRKCEVLCANCHSIHSYEEKHWRNRYVT